MGNITPSPFQHQVGTRHQFTWNQGVDEVGIFNLTNFPNPPTLAGPGVAIEGATQGGTIGTGVGFGILRGSDNVTGTVSIPAGTYSLSQIATAINSAFPPPAIAFVGGRIGAPSGQALYLIDKKPLVGDASIQIGFDPNNLTAANLASRLTGLHFGKKSTAQTAATICQIMDNDPEGVVPLGGSLSDVFQIPPGADTVSLLLRVSTFNDAPPILRLFWSDGQAPFNGSTASLVLPPSTLLPNIKSYADYGIQEMGVVPNPDPQFSAYPIDPTNTYQINGQAAPYLIDALTNEVGVDFWFSRVIELKPPAGMTQLRIDFPATLKDETVWTAGLAYLSRIQAYAWGSRRGV